MRIPTVLLKCKVVAVGAVGLMTASTVGDFDWLARWALLVSVLAAGMCLRAAVRETADAIKEYVMKWSLQVFEDGFKAGVDQGREMEAAEQFIAQVDRG